MEKEFYNDDFEHFLKDASDNFRMYPSKRVWHSIYNDLHPSRKWPSFAVTLFLITAILFIGVSNNNYINTRIARQSFKDNMLAAEGKSTISLPVASHGSIPSGNEVQLSSNGTNPSSRQLAANDQLPLDESISSSYSNGSSLNSTGHMNINIIGSTPEEFTEVMVVKNPVDADKDSKLASSNRVKLTHHSSNAMIKDQTSSSSFNEVEPTASIAGSQDPRKKQAINLQEKTTVDRAWIDDYAFHNKPFLKKAKLKGALQYYVTPSVGFRTLEQTSKADVNSRSLIAVNSNTSQQDINDLVTQSAAINLEAGAVFLYNLSKRLRFKTGVQMNYTNYIINAYELHHPVMATVMMNDANGYPTLLFRNTTLGNNVGGEIPKKLNNNTVQFSVPLGADFKLAGNDRLKWYAGASVQPTYISGGHAYVLSADAKNYVEESSLLRKFNLNAGFETFVSYKMASGVTLNAGPQFRYQFLSTYNKQYTYSEKLYNIGLKLGMTTNF